MTASPVTKVCAACERERRRFRRVSRFFPLWTCHACRALCCKHLCGNKLLTGDKKTATCGSCQRRPASRHSADPQVTETKKARVDGQAAGGTRLRRLDRGGPRSSSREYETADKRFHVAWQRRQGARSGYRVLDRSTDTSLRAATLEEVRETIRDMRANDRHLPGARRRAATTTEVARIPEEALHQFQAAVDLLRGLQGLDSRLSLYVANDTLNLMTGPTHDEGGRPLRDNVVESEAGLRITGGDW